MIKLKKKLIRQMDESGVVMSQENVNTASVEDSEDDTDILWKKRNTILRELSGSHKFSKSTKQLMKEMDEELYND